MIDLSTVLRREISLNLDANSDRVSRVFHGRGRFFPRLESINVEWYPPILFVQCYEDVLSEEAKAGLLGVFEENSTIHAVILQTRAWPDVENTVLASRDDTVIELPIDFDARLGDDLKCKVNIGENRNTGVFPDMRAGWQWIKANSSGKRVLNLFSYTSVFSLFALQGGARKVVNIDMCGSATKTAKSNHELNDFDDERVSIWKKNIIKSNSQIAKQSKFDIVVLDPPPFHKGSFKGWADYQKILRRSANYSREDGIILAALNDQQVTFSEFEANIFDTLDSAKGVEQLALTPEIKELEPEKGLKLAIIRL